MYTLTDAMDEMVFKSKYILRIYGLYLAVSKVSTFPCPLKVNNGSQRLNFYKNEDRSLPRNV